MTLGDGLALLATVSVVAWAWLLWARGGFWRADQRLPAEPVRADLPAVVAIVPARNEAETIGWVVRSLLAQEGGASLKVIVVDDDSDDGTAAVAQTAAQEDSRVHVIAGAPLPGGWTGKLWAIEQGVRHARHLAPDAQYVWLTDADVVHRPDALRRLVAYISRGGFDLVSLMVRLRCERFWERLLIPAFVFFFQKLYPFPWVNDPKRPEAGAAGGCMLVRRSKLMAAGGVATIRDQLIDDCALATVLKQRGPIWLGLADGSDSLRGYDRLADLWRMVTRTAFTQLRHSVVRLIGAVVGMGVLYLAPPVAVMGGLFSGHWPAVACGVGAWVAIVVAYRPTLTLFGLAAAWGVFLPFVGLLYTAMTVDSAHRYWRGHGGVWKGRIAGGVANGST